MRHSKMKREENKVRPVYFKKEEIEVQSNVRNLS